LHLLTPENLYMATEAGIGSRVEHPHFGRGVIVDLASETYIIWFKSQQGIRSIGKDFEGLSIIEKKEAETGGAGITVADIEVALERVLAQRLHEVEMVPIAGKWHNGNLVLQPADKTLQGKEISLETFFHKIVMVRDKLRLIEQKINASKNLDAAEKVDLTQYLTGIYGSLTTFNVLFRENHHQFKGAGKD
jgi:hypothetical protein